MREIRTSGLMSGERKRSDAHRAQATAPLLDSTPIRSFGFWSELGIIALYMSGSGKRGGRCGYHHGNLRETLGQAALDLIGDKGRRMAGDEDDGLDLTVAKRLRLVLGTELAHTGETEPHPAERAHHDFHRRALSGAGVADVDPVAGQVRDRFDVRVRPGQHRERFRIQREDGAQFQVRADIAELARPIVGMELPIRLYDGQIQRTLAHAFQILDRPAGALDDALRIVGEVLDLLGIWQEVHPLRYTQLTPEPENPCGIYPISLETRESPCDPFLDRFSFDHDSR